MRSWAWRARFAALLGLGSYVLHQGRFLLAYGSRSTDELALQGHGYLTVVGPVLGALVFVAAAEFALRLGREKPHRSVPSLARIWVWASSALLAVYCAQELAEGLSALGHPAGLTGIFGGGGWLGIPLALAIGLLIALLMRGAAAVVELVARRRRQRRPLRSPRQRGAPATEAARRAFLLGASAPRAPPPASV